MGPAPLPTWSDPETAPAQILSGAVANRGRVVRVGDTVRRPLAPRAPATHALLAHLHEVGFDGAPRVLEAGPEIETLSWIPGRAAANPLPDWAVSDSTLVSVAQLLRRFHDAVASFDPSGLRWQIDVPAAYRDGLVSHNDAHPGNIIFVDGVATGLIDFDLAGPGSAVWDLATAARCWCPLVDDTDLPSELRAGTERRFHRLGLLLDAYGLARADRVLVVDALIANHDWTYRIVTDAVGSGHRGFGDYWRAVAPQTGRARAWSVRHAPALRAAVA